MTGTPRSLAHKPLTLHPIPPSPLGCDGIHKYPEPPAQLTCPFPLPPFPAPVSCFIDCLAWLPPALPSQAGSSPTPPPRPTLPPFLSLPTSVSTCPSPAHLRIRGCLTECGDGSGCLPDSRDQVLNPVAVFPGPASSDGFPNS